MSTEPQRRAARQDHPRWTGWELAGLIAVVWFLAFLVYLVLTATP
jgi:hypothetical protein